MRTLEIPEGLANQLAAFLGGGTALKHDATGTPTASGYAHGPGGLLTFPGVDPLAFHTIVGLEGGILSELPAVPTNYMTPLYEIITGVQADIGSEKSAICDVPPVGGLMKLCRQTAQFGFFDRATPELSAIRMGQLENRGDPVDVRLANRLTIPGAGVLGSAQGVGNPLVNEMDKRLFERAVSLHRKLRKMIYTGSTANNLGDGYAEFPGIDALIRTGYTDAITNQACPAADSDVKDMNFARVDLNGSDVVNAITYLVRNTTRTARQVGLDPVRFALVMRETLFYEVTKVWPCAYYTNGCATAFPTTVNQQGHVDLGDMTSMRDDMRQNRYLLVDGMRVDVVLDEAIPELTQTNNANVPGPQCVASDIYLVPFSVLGGTAVTYLEYFNWDNASLNTMRQTMPNVMISTNGPWIETMRQTMYCVQFIAGIMPRLIMRTPFLAGVLQNVAYCPLQHGRDAFPSDPYFVNGGATGDGWPDGPSFWAAWRS